LYHATTARRVLDGVRDQVEQQLTQPRSIAHDDAVGCDERHARMGRISQAIGEDADVREVEFGGAGMLFHPKDLELAAEMLGLGDLTQAWPAELQRHYARGFSVARRLGLLLTIPRFLPAMGPIAMRSPPPRPNSSCFSEQFGQTK